MSVASQGAGRCWQSLQLGVVALVFTVGLWQLARAGWDWRAVLDSLSVEGFFLAMATLPVFGFPISACYVYAGLAFEPWEGIIACWAALAINMSVSYALARSVFSRPLRRFMDRRGWSIPQLGEKNQFRVTFLVRTVPGPPFFFQNLALGIAGIPFWSYLWVSLLAQGGIAVGVILCSRYLSEDPWGKGGVTVMAILVALLMAKALMAWRQKKVNRA